ncbi:MAG: sulfurtransferase-like selenium metabolism protein YedF [Polyangia bacterium]
MAERETVDARGLSCPQPVIAARKKISEPGVTSAAVLVDNDASAENVSRMARAMGCEVRLEDTGDGCFRVLLDRGDAVQPDPAGADSAEESRARACRLPSRVAVMVASDTLGRGSEELGRLLTVAFVKTLREVVPRPETLIFMNGGVRLVCEGGELVEAVGEIERLGVRVLICGTCLDFFGLEEKLEVGTISNMFEIASTLMEADRVVRP